MGRVDAAPQVGDQRLDPGTSLASRRTLDFLDDAAADDDCIGDRGNRPGRRRIADPEADTDRNTGAGANRRDARGHACHQRR